MQTKDSNILRVFFALWPEIAIQQALYAIAKEYQPKCEAHRLMQMDTLHMTLQFIGEVALSRLPQLIKAADRVSIPTFEIVLERLSYWQHNRIAYAAPKTAIPALNRLVTSLRQELTKENILFSGNEFSPHVTLLRHVEHVTESKIIMPIAWLVNAFVLVESVTTQQGVNYRILQKWPLHHRIQTISPTPPTAQQT